MSYYISQDAGAVKRVETKDKLHLFRKLKATKSQCLLRFSFSLANPGRKGLEVVDNLFIRDTGNKTN